MSLNTKMIFIALLIAVFAVYVLQSKLYGERIFSKLQYKAYFGCEESEEGDEIYMIEEIRNIGSLPIPNAKVSTRLQDGLKFKITDKKDGKIIYTESVQSVFVLRGHAVIRRKWTIKCEKRGVYKPQGCVIVVNDLFGTGATSKSITQSELECGRVTKLNVIPAIGELPDCGAETKFMLGDKAVLLGLLTDPLNRNGIREYRDGDSMNSVNWTATAAHDTLLVNSCEFTRERRYNIILNLRSRDNERDSHIPSIPQITEDSIKVCAALLNKAAASQPSVRLIVNTLSDTDTGRELVEKSAYRTADKPSTECDTDVKKSNADNRLFVAERDVWISSAFVGRRDISDALIALSELPLYYTCTLEKLLEAITDGDMPCALDGSFVIVTPYVNDRILKFHDTMKARGVGVAFYLSSASQFDISERSTDAEIIKVQLNSSAS